MLSRIREHVDSERKLGALTTRPKFPGRISGNFHGQMVQSFSSVELFAWNFSMTSRFKSQIEKQTEH